MTNYGDGSGGFYEFFFLNDMRALCFSENRRFFLTKYGHESCLFIENGRFLTKYGHESSDFFVRNWKKKGILFIFVAHNGHNRLQF